MPVRNAHLAIVLLLIPLFSLSQVNVSGTVADQNGEPLPMGNVRLLTEKKALITGTTTAFDGRFSLSVPADSSFILLISYVGFESRYVNLATGKTPVVLEAVKLKPDQKFLKEVEVVTTQTRGEQRGDTTAFNAGAYKTNPDASAEDLIKKMPGFTSDREGVKVNGETVQKVLVDGKPFFGDDPNAALKNLPAELIDKVEVFDKMSDQAAFTGFDDGEQQKTINIVTKKEKNRGQFGRIYAGAGADEDPTLRYNAGAAINSFSNQRRLTLLLLGNNINQQNFSSADLSGTSGQQGGRGGTAGGRRSSGSALLAPDQNGITTTRSAGLNFSDEWGKKIEISGSYFFNSTENVNRGTMVRNYFTDDNLVYKQENEDISNNTNHRLNLRIEYQIDSSNKIIYVPSFSAQDNRAASILKGQNLISDITELSNTTTRSGNNNAATDFSNFLLLQHKFRKNGRTLSLRLNTNNSLKNNAGDYYSSNNYGDTVSTALDQTFRTISHNNRYLARLSYTEPLSKYSQLQLSYKPSLSDAASDKRTNDYDPLEMDYTDFNNTLSNTYRNTYRTQNAGIDYKYRKDRINLSVGSDVQEATLSGVQTYPVSFGLNQTFRNILPGGRLNFKFSKSRNLHIRYRTSTNIPSITELQDVVDISNPLQVRSGNSSLKQTFENNLYLRLGGFDAKTSRNIMLFAHGSYIDDYITNAVYVLKNDSLIQGFNVKAGSQLSKPVNLDNYYSARMFMVYGFPAPVLKSNLNLNGGLNYANTPGLFDNQLNYSSSYAINGGIFLGSNINENLDFSLSYNANYTIVKNTFQKRSDNNFFSHNTGFKVNWIFLKGFVINTDLVYTSFTGLSQAFNQQYILWNGSIGYKFLKNRALEARLSVFDILNQNRAISRTVTGAYTEDNFTNVLKRYGLFTLTYTLRNFRNGTPPAEKNEGGPGGHPGARPPGHH